MRQRSSSTGHCAATEAVLPNEGSAGLAKTAGGILDTDRHTDVAPPTPLRDYRGEIRNNERRLRSEQPDGAIDGARRVRHG